MYEVLVLMSKLDMDMAGARLMMPMNAPRIIPAAENPTTRMPMQAIRRAYSQTREYNFSA